MLCKFNYWHYTTIIVIYQNFPATLGALVHKIILFWISGIKLSDQGICPLKMVRTSEGEASLFPLCNIYSAGGFCSLFFYLPFFFFYYFYFYCSIHTWICVLGKSRKKNWMQLWWEKNQNFPEVLNSATD